MLQGAKRLGLPPPVMLIVSGNRAPHLAGPQHDIDTTILHSLNYQDFWAAFEHRYGSNPDLVAAAETTVYLPKSCVGFWVKHSVNAAGG